MSKRADIVLVGGGSGGHLTPLIPIAEELNKINPKIKIAHIGQKQDTLNEIVKSSNAIDDFHEINAGKYRRYNGESWFQKITDIKTILLNIRDFFRLILGIYQAWKLLGEIKPKIIFMKGGYVGVPVGLAAKWRKIDYITHDSDAMISLANKIISSGASLHLVAANPAVYLGYDREKTVQVGVPIRAEFKKVDDKIKNSCRNKLNLPIDSKVILVVGGGLGARNINNAFIKGAEKILESDSNIVILHISGGKLYDEVKGMYAGLGDKQLQNRIQIISFSERVYDLSAAADLIITRAGATNIAEFSVQGKACIVVPNPLLSGGHQLKNAVELEKNSAAIIINESELNSSLTDKVLDVIEDNRRIAQLETELNKLSFVDAAARVAEILYEKVQKPKAE